MAIATTLGYPCIGRNRELKKVTEAYWASKTGQDELLAAGTEIRRQSWERQQHAGIELVASNDFSLYDHVLDTSALVGAVPERYQFSGGIVPLDTYFAMARGSVEQDLPAMEMTKWFNTNYHYIVPEFRKGMAFSLSSRKPFEEFQEAKDFGLVTKPVLLGPVSFLLLGKQREESFELFDLLDSLLGIYGDVIRELGGLGAGWIQFDEPAFVQDRTSADREALRHAYEALSQASGTVKIAVQTYFDGVGDAYADLVSLPVQGVGLDFVHDGGSNAAAIGALGFPDDKVLTAGVVDARNVWVNDLRTTIEKLRDLGVPQERLMISPTGSLMFSPIDAELEDQLDPEVRSWLAFADQKLTEVSVLARGVTAGTEAIEPELAARDTLVTARSESSRIHRSEIKQRADAEGGNPARRATPFAERKHVQAQKLGLPPLPTTTVGSFPQTPELRRDRRLFENGSMPEAEYDGKIENRIREVIEFQDGLGLDVLVHGEFERSDMVEYFGERMDGFAFTRHGWVRSYGSRCVRPPIIYGDVHRPQPMTVRWFEYAQSCTEKPMKGMLTGPVTILNWSFVRDDQPRADTCLQIALALRDEVMDLEAAGASIIQIDEPALREGMPLRQEKWGEYLEWAIRCFRAVVSTVRPDTQIHTHMCYSDFNSIIDSILAMDADVVSIENSRSELELLDVFRREGYANDIGPGVYDIHSPRVPSVEEMRTNLEASARVLSPDQLWVNPDCGLKTRTWAEVEPSLANMVAAARLVRERMMVSA